MTAPSQSRDANGADEKGIGERVMAVPFEAQANFPEERRCGAAALCMVYRFFGVPCAQDVIWKKLARPDFHGRVCARSYLMAKDAVERGLHGLVIQAGAPWRILQTASAHGIPVILNHLYTHATTVGHFSVLVGLGGDFAVLHDPALGPSRRVERDDLLALWQPARATTEVTGNVLVAIAAQPTQATKCAECGGGIPAVVQCDYCREPIRLQPSIVLGCVTAGCPARNWRRIYCPACDGVIGRIGTDPLK